ncbi:type VI secretion system baseplate subunit TssG [Massilia norwichensis]|uniref:Type VI secretion system baseplate subunit TssG n=1 Tax=Massilia norwichensis TaxID=1442366 RepID=A0ABT2AE95_9BURK|nr:type VI secretion system baseplate subunit TssG [Massilia norwichensis]MCS0592531.1 type VI secretion system baseplate subunit TssG [Massilia norwichensis]
MQTTQRQHAALLIEPLLAAPYRYRFAQLLNILVRMLRRQGIPYNQAFGQVLRFRNSLSLAFPASEIEGMQVGATDDGTPRIHITPTFIGLLGASGTLPLHDTERAASKANLGADESWKPFVDLFSNRVIGLFYEAWGKYRVEHGLDTRGRDDLLPLLSALGGVRPASFGPNRPYTSIPVEVAGYYAGLLRTRPIAAATVERVLGEYFGVPVRVEEFVGAWDAIPEKIRSTLGVTEPTLGYGAALGARAWRNDLRVRLHIGPLDEETAKSFLPNGRSHAALQEMVSLFAVPSVQYEVRLLLDKPCLKPLTLATRGPDRKRLGLNSFLTVSAGKASRADIRSVLRLTTRAC